MKTNQAKILWCLSVATTLEAEDAVADLLATLTGQSASSYFDLERQASLVSVYCQQAKSPAPQLRRAIHAGLANIQDCGLPTGAGRIKITRVRPEDWSESWKRHFKPLEIGRALLIKPSWSKRPPKKGQATVILDPGLSFGTGQHPTTSFCLSEVARPAENSAEKIATRSFLDIGTGSGILAIAAAKLNFAPIDAFDFDPESVRVAKSNAKINQVSQKISLTQADATRLPLRPARRYDLVCANLISNLLLAQRKRIIAQLNKGGTLVLAGILQTEFHTVRAAFTDLGWELVRTEIQKEWQSGAFQNKNKV